MKELLFRKIKEYVPVQDKEIQTIDSLFKIVEYKADEILLREGSVCSTLWFIAKGLVRYTTNTDGDERTFIFRNEGNFISDIEGFIKQIPATKSIVAIEDCTLFAISKSDLKKFFSEVSEGEKLGRLLIENIFVAAVNHIVSFYTESPETRYIKLLKQNKDFIQRILQYHIASFLGVKPIL